MITEKDGLIKRRFKHITDDQAIELALRIEKKLEKGCRIEDAMMFIQAYACIEELLTLRDEIQQNESLRRQAEYDITRNEKANPIGIS